MFTPPSIHRQHKNSSKASSDQITIISSKELILSDKQRNKNLPRFQIWLRRKQTAKNPLWKLVCKVFYRISGLPYCNDIQTISIGNGLYIGHPYGITINKDARIGNYVNIHKGVTIGQENRGKRKGVPTIGSKVWIGINATIVGRVIIGDDVLIAPNTYINCDIPSHSIVFGNPAIIRHADNATEHYVN